MTDQPSPLIEPALPATRLAGGLSGPVSSAVRWSAAEQVARVTTMVVLTRLVDPREFGLAALAFLLSSLAPLLGDLGLGAALVHHPDLEERHVHTAFTAGAVIGGILTLLTALAAPVVAAFFDEPDLRPLLPVIGATFLLRGLVATPRDLLRRRLRLGPVVLSVATAVVVSGAVAIVAAARGAGAWALVIYAVGENAIALVLIWLVARRERVWRPRLQWDRNALRELLRFGVPVSAHQILYYGQSHLDDILVGRYLGAEPLGFYGLAYRLMLFPIVKVADVVHAMVFPALASMQAQAARFQGAFARAVQAVALVCFPASIGIAVVAPTLIRVAFGPRWDPAAVVVQVLALNGPRLVLVRLGGAAFQAVGRPTWELRITAITFALCGVAFAVGLPFGIEGVAVGYTVAGYLVLPTVLGRLARAMGTTIKAILRPLAPIVGATAMMAAATAAVVLAGAGLPEGLRLALAVLTGALVYAGILWSRWRPLLRSVAADLLGRGR